MGRFLTLKQTEGTKLNKKIVVEKDGKEIEVTEKAFKVVYEAIGFKKVKRTTKKASPDES